MNPGLLTPNLILILISLVVDDVVESQFVNTLGDGDDTEPVTELLLLEELLGPAHTISVRRYTNKIKLGLAGVCVW